MKGSPCNDKKMRDSSEWNYLAFLYKIIFTEKVKGIILIFFRQKRSTSHDLLHDDVLKVFAHSYYSFLNGIHAYWFSFFLMVDTFFSLYCYFKSLSSFLFSGCKGMIFKLVNTSNTEKETLTLKLSVNTWIFKIIAHFNTVNFAHKIGQLISEPIS